MSTPRLTFQSTQDSSANAAQALSITAVKDRRHYCTEVTVFSSAAAPGADVTVVLRDGPTTTGTALWKGIIGSGATRGASVGIVFATPRVSSPGKALTLDVSAGGTSVVTSANIAGWTE